MTTNVVSYVPDIYSSLYSVYLARMEALRTYLTGLEETRTANEETTPKNLVTTQFSWRGLRVTPTDQTTNVQTTTWRYDYILQRYKEDKPLFTSTTKPDTTQTTRAYRHRLRVTTRKPYKQRMTTTAAPMTSLSTTSRYRRYSRISMRRLRTTRHPSILDRESTAEQTTTRRPYRITGLRRLTPQSRFRTTMVYRKPVTRPVTQPTTTVKSLSDLHANHVAQYWKTTVPTMPEMNSAAGLSYYPISPDLDGHSPRGGAHPDFGFEPMSDLPDYLMQDSPPLIYNPAVLPAPPTTQQQLYNLQPAEDNSPIYLRTEYQQPMVDLPRNLYNERCLAWPYIVTELCWPYR